ncbi:MAG: hypothetical protein H6725_11885 [Sandaracinaceae bacterium]|nr:hypothetical protein [Sandaracinaceae bacterium]
MPLDRDSAFLLALGASIVVHVLGAGAAAAFRREAPASPGVIREDRVELEWLELAVERDEAPDAPEAPLEPPAPGDPSVVTGAASIASRVIRSGEEDSELQPWLDPGDPSDAPSQPSEVDPRRPVVPRGTLDPRAVALGALDVAPHQVAPQAQPSAEDPSARYRRAEATLDGHLAARAAERPAVTERPRPRVRRQPDGSHVYAGHAFTARIDADGQVTFSDRAPIAYSGGGDMPSSAAVAFGFDLTDGAYRRRGQDPYQAERAWFMSQTEELREELQLAARERERASMARRVAGRAQRIWDTEERSEEARRRRIFALWDDCAEGDADGDAARRSLLGWVRRQLPAGSERAFTPAELAALNASRQSAQAFAPY